MPVPPLVPALLLALQASSPSPSDAGDPGVAFVGARLIPISGPEIENGILVVRDGLILHVGAADVTPIPVGAEVRDVAGRVLMPGLVDTHSHVGGPEGGDASDPIQPDVRVLDSIDPRASGLDRARAGGITTLNVMPGSGHLCSGQTSYLKLRDADTLEELCLRDARGRPLGGLKMANGTNSRGEPPFPGTRAKSAALVRQRFVAAQEYAAAIARAAGDPAKAPARDLGLEVLAEALAGERVVHHHTHRHDDVLTVLRLAEEFRFPVVLHHVSDGWKVAGEIAAAGVPCSVIAIDSPGGKLEAKDLSFETGGALERAGCLVALHTDDPITDSRLFLRSAALAVRGGMSREGALAAVTLAGARILGLEARAGSLEVGKDADFVLLDGDPLSVYTHVLETWVEGVKVFDRARPEDRLIAVGGEGATRGETAHACCEEVLR